MTFIDSIKSLGIRFLENVPTERISSIKAGGIAEAMIFPKTQQELFEVIKLCLNMQVPYKILGGCSNTCFSDEGFSGILISTKGLDRFEITADNFLFAECGASLSQLIRSLADRSISLSDRLFGIPGTVGGAIRNNSGAFGEEISRCFIDGCFFDPSNNKLITLCHSDLAFEYRSSLLKKTDLVFVSGRFSIILSNREEIYRRISDSISYRRERHPTDPSLGSFFKRSSDCIPAEMIEKAGLKGFRIGDAAISEKHSGFIVNKGNAKVCDIEKLACTVEAVIYEKTGIKLEREAEIIPPQDV